MQHKKTVAVPATTRDIISHTTCDLCGEKIGTYDNYDVNETEVRHKTGVGYPDGGSGKEVIADICGKCFDTKLVPWLRAQGAVPREEEWSY